jgi:hypothetical protein
VAAAGRTENVESKVAKAAKRIMIELRRGWKLKGDYL